MNSQHEQTQNLDDALRREFDTLNTLFNILEQERAALETQDIDRVTQLARTKQTLTEDMERATLQRFKLMQAGEHDRQALSPSLRTLWHQILELARKCHNANEVNGRIILMSQSSVQRSLRLIRGQSTDPALTYTSRGQPLARLTRLQALKV